MAAPDFTAEEHDGVSRPLSDASPTHYTVKIQSFSLVSKNSINRYETGDFEAGGYKWKLVLYPNGNKSRNVKDNISVYLAMTESSSLPLGWEVNVLLRLFLRDQIRDNYVLLQDTKETGRRFHAMETEWGFDQFIPLKSFNEASNGYLVDDACVFGAEVFVCKERSTGKGECLSMIEEPASYKHTWKIENFSKIDTECYDSKPFITGGHEWKVQIYPKGKGDAMGSFVSLYLASAEPATLPPGRRLYVDFTLRLVDQSETGAIHKDYKATRCFSASNQKDGWERLISLTTFHRWGFLAKDNCIVEAEVTVLGVSNTLS